MFSTGVSGKGAKLVPVPGKVVARRGSNVTLVCLGSDVSQLDTYIYWNFNGKEISRGDSEWPTEGKANFYLHITNVSEKDVGEYDCVATVSNGLEPSDDTEASIELQLYESGT